MFFKKKKIKSKKPCFYDLGDGLVPYNKDLFKWIEGNYTNEELEEQEKRAVGIAESMKNIKFLYYRSNPFGIIEILPIKITRFWSTSDIVRTLFINKELYSYFDGERLEYDLDKDGDPINVKQGGPKVCQMLRSDFFGVKIKELFFVDEEGRLINLFDMNELKFRHDSNEPKGSFLSNDPYFKSFSLKIT